MPCSVSAVISSFHAILFFVPVCLKLPLIIIFATSENYTITLDLRENWSQLLWGHVLGSESERLTIECDGKTTFKTQADDFAIYIALHYINGYVRQRK